MNTIESLEDDFTDWLINPDEPDLPVAVPAGELFEWAWLVADLGTWLADAATTTRFDLHRYFGGEREPAQAARQLADIRSRIGQLLADSPGQPHQGGRQ